MPEDNHLAVKENKEINSSPASRYEPRPYKSLLAKDYFGVSYRPTSNLHRKRNQYLTLFDNTFSEYSIFHAVMIYTETQI